MPRSLRRVALAAFVAACPPAPALAQEPAPDTLRALVAAGVHPDMRWPGFPDVRRDATRLYEHSGWGALWIADGRPTRSARALAATMRYAELRGLDPRDYDAGALEARLDSARMGQYGPGALARLDVQMTVNVLRYVRALREGRVSARAAHAELQLPRTPFDPVGPVEVLRVTAEPDRVLDALEPQFIHYELLKRALVGLRALERDSGLVPLPRPRLPLKPGQAYHGAPALRRLLATLRDLPDSAVAPPADTLHANGLVEGVRRFQRRHGLTPDGVIGPGTLVELNRSIGERVRQIELTLERWRWLPSGFDAPPIVVNVPAFRLYAFGGARDEEASILAMNVVVGSAFETATPMFSSDMTYLVFRPYWEVPKSIALAEVVPKAAADSTWLARNEYELVRGARVVPATADNLAAIGTTVRVRQKPGPRNSLGLLKFMLPNANNVYLHDTPQKSHFSRTRRDFSHGCIRVADPVALARHVLRDQPEWTEERIRASMDTATKPLSVPLTRPIPVLIVYATAVATEGGELQFYPDIYKMDAALDALLRKGYPYPR